MVNKVIRCAFWTQINNEDRCNKFLKHDFVGKAWEKDFKLDPALLYLRQYILYGLRHAH